MPYLSVRDLEELNKWVYKVEGVTITDSFMRKWWNIAFQFVPLRTSPALLTSLGFLSTVISSCLTIAYAPKLIEEAPRWVYVLCALGMFFYQTMDSLDGKQCRRTGRSSGIEELFDHGCDSLACSLFYIITTSCFRMGHQPELWLTTLYVGNMLFFSVHWRTYVTGVTYVGRYLRQQNRSEWTIRWPFIFVIFVLVIRKIDHTETQLASIFVLLTTTMFGTGIWSYKVVCFEVSFSLADVLMYMTIITGLLKICFNISGTLKYNTSLLPVSTLFLGKVMLVMTFYHARDMIVEQNMLVAFGLLVGFFSAKQDQRINVAHMANKKMDVMDSSLIYPAAVCCTCLLIKSTGIFLLKPVVICCSVASFIDVLVYFTQVNRELARFYGFDIFRLKPNERIFYVIEDVPDPNNALIKFGANEICQPDSHTLKSESNSKMNIKDNKKQD